MFRCACINTIMLNVSYIFETELNLLMHCSWAEFSCGDNGWSQSNECFL